MAVYFSPANSQQEQKMNPYLLVFRLRLSVNPIADTTYSLEEINLSANAVFRPQLD